MNYDDEIQEEVMRYGSDPDSCPECRERFSGRCKFHRDLENWREYRAEQDRGRREAN